MEPPINCELRFALNPFIPPCPSLRNCSAIGGSIACTFGNALLAYPDPLVIADMEAMVPAVIAMVPKAALNTVLDVAIARLALIVLVFDDPNVLAWISVFSTPLIKSVKPNITSVLLMVSTLN